ncbi:hypothetical protein HMPREF0762_01595 [Slackia exigua ATCC 700122]|uniref:Uncharacterized protein n=1 Tax=Slackia exigua (strain ATCC 700122 / DSM 15923 / CIP 105133 / JCM 11022 / KCTC 5966 / S-7) TaxID=649764 RepID=D0WIC0_SLAES|nr:hypothetical protein HMPREF0762_01595 [Slackia exigua ATCC 700122]
MSRCPEPPCAAGTSLAFLSQDRRIPRFACAFERSSIDAERAENGVAPPCASGIFAYGIE